MHESAIAEPKIAGLLRQIVTATRLEVDFTVRHHAGQVPDLTVEFKGPDTPCLTARNGELLKALEHLAAKVWGLDSDEHHLLSCDAGNFKRDRDRALRASARHAVRQVCETSLPYNFAPMSSHERRQLHLILAEMGLTTASFGEGRDRRVILYPAQGR